MGNKDGMNYAPKGKINRVVEPGVFNVGVTALDHGHINGMTNGLIEAGATIKYVYDPDAEKVANYLESFPEVAVAESLEQILEDPEIQLVAAAAVPNLRSALGNRVMRAGKDYFTDKTGFTTSEQLEETKKEIAETGTNPLYPRDRPFRVMLKPARVLALCFALVPPSAQALSFQAQSYAETNYKTEIPSQLYVVMPAGFSF